MRGVERSLRARRARTSTGVWPRSTAQLPVERASSRHTICFSGDEGGAFATLARFIAERDDIRFGAIVPRSPDGGVLHERARVGFSHGPDAGHHPHRQAAVRVANFASAMPSGTRRS
jgi:hypothetical protein